MNLDLEKVRPLRGKLLGEIIGGDSVSAGGIILVDTGKKKKPRKVRVVRLGGPFENDKGELQEYRARPGQITWFKMAEGERLTINRKDYLVLENADIVAVED